MSPDLALSSTLIGSNYPCLELIFLVPKVFEPLKFDCIGGDCWRPRNDIKAPDNDEKSNWWHFFTFWHLIESPHRGFIYGIPQ